MHKYPVIIEKYGNGYSAFAPDVPDCVAAGDSVDEAETLMREALRLHLDDMKATGQTLPEPSAILRFVEA